MSNNIIFMVILVLFSAMVILKNESDKTDEIDKKKYSILKEWSTEYEEIKLLISSELQESKITNASFDKIKEKKLDLDKQRLISEITRED